MVRELSLNPLVRLAANATMNGRRYILFAGAGVSRDAGLPSAWDIMMATASILRRAEGPVSTEPTEEWFLSSSYASMSYSEIMEKIFPEQRSQDDFLIDQLPVGDPGESHKMIAELAHRGVIRAVITTNFDDRIERALESRSIPVQILATEEDFSHAQPLIHEGRFRVYKPHGTLGRGRLRNTPADLDKLPDAISDGLLRAIDDHGLIIQGYAGADVGILDVLSRRRRNFYPVFWLSSSAPHEKVVAACGNDLVHVTSTSASASLRDLMYIYGELANLAPEHRPSWKLADVERRIEEMHRSAPIDVSEVIEEMIKVWLASAPDLTGSDEPDELFLEAISKTVGVSIDFARICRMAVVSSNSNVCDSIYDSFSEIRQLEDETLGRKLTSYNSLNSGYGRFIYYECFLVFFGYLLKYDRYSDLKRLLGRALLDKDGTRRNWYDQNNYVNVVDDLRKKKIQSNKISLMPDLFKQRHGSDVEFGKIAPYSMIWEADYFLMLRAAFDSNLEGVGAALWPPASMVSNDSWPQFMRRAVRADVAAGLTLALGEVSLDETKRKLQKFRDLNQRIFSSGFVRSPGDFKDNMIERIGSIS